MGQEQAALARKIRRLVEAIGDGQAPAAGGPPVLGQLDLARLEQEVADPLGRFAELLRRNVPRARQALKKLLVDRVEFSPVDSGKGRKTYRFRGELGYGAVLQGSGIYAWCPQGDFLQIYTPGSSATYGDDDTAGRDGSGVTQAR